jgi:uncharacterized membrane protein
MNRTSLLTLAIVLAVFGVVDSWYLYQSAVNHTALACDIGAGLDGCNIVAQSVYSQLFGIPLALYGIGFFGAMLLTSIGLLSFPRRLLYGALLGFAIMGALASVVFVYIQAVLIQAFCVYCILSATIAFCLLGPALSLWTRFASVKPVITD